MNILEVSRTALSAEVVGEFITTAFSTARFSGGQERAMFDEVRASDRYIPELTLVAIEEDELIGFVMLSTTSLVTDASSIDVLNLGPVCTREDVRNRAVGTALISAALDAARGLGYESVFLAGDRSYYARFGFRPASTWGIRCQHDVPTELLDNIMGLELVEGAVAGRAGTVTL